MSHQSSFCENHAQVSAKVRYRFFAASNLGLMAFWGLFSFETLQELHTGWVVIGMLGLAFWSSLIFRSQLESWLKQRLQAQDPL
ncbi:uncharacterized protein METZ01_LOCUS372600, partial [marine metagenome]